jgi:hypothetical protein
MSLKTYAAVAFIALLALGATSSAAEPSPVNPWLGLYVNVGGNVGEAFGGNKFTFLDQSSGQTLSFQGPSTSSSMLVGGFQIGQLWYVGGTALGIEDDVTLGKNINYLQSLRAVLGVPTGPFLIYGTGGIGFENARRLCQVWMGCRRGHRGHGGPTSECWC